MGRFSHHLVVCAKVVDDTENQLSISCIGIVRVQVHVLCVCETFFKTCEDMFHPFL